MVRRILVAVLAVACLPVPGLADDRVTTRSGVTMPELSALHTLQTNDELAVRLERAQRQRRIANRWVTAGKWAGLAALGFGLGGWLETEHDRALGIGALASMSVMGMGIWGRFARAKADREITEIQAQQTTAVVSVSPVTGGLVAQYRVGW